MPSTITDRLYGLTTSVALKAPCRVATTVPITLSGPQTIDGVAVVAGDRVLVKNQAAASENGIWICAAAAWTRAADFDGSFDAVQGTLVYVLSGSANTSTYWEVTTAGQLVISVDDVAFEMRAFGALSRVDEFTATAGQTAFTLAYTPLSTAAVYVNGVRLMASDYTVSGTALTLDDARSDGDTVVVVSSETPTGPDAFSHTASYATGTIRKKLQQAISVTDAPYNAAGDGTTDDTAAIQAAIDSLGASGGSVLIPWGKRCLVDSNLTVKPNVSLVGPHQFVGSPGTNVSAPYGSVGGALLLNSAATITLKGSASLNGLLIHRKGMTFPAADASAFAGTAVTAGGDDVAVSHCQILGFNKAFYSTGFNRPRLENIWWDCVNGFEITQCFDVPYLTNLHGWPFATIQSGASWTVLVRTGTAYYLHDTVDHAKLTNIFSYGYMIGLRLNDVNSTVGISCGFDNATDPTPLQVGSKGVVIEGSCAGTRITGLQSSGMDAAGVEIALDAGKFAHIDGVIWVTGATGAAVLVTSGDCHLVGEWRDHSNGIIINSAASRIGGDVWVNSVTQIVNTSVTTPNFNVRLRFAANIPDGRQVVAGGAGASSAPSVASADPLNLPMNGETFRITGTTDFGTLTGGYRDRQVMLIFADVLDVFSGTGSIGSIRLLGGATYTTGANVILTLKHDGTQWWEVGRA